MSALSACAQILLPFPETLAPKPLASSDGALQLSRVVFEELPGWKAEQHNSALPAFLKSCVKWQDKPANQLVGPLNEMGRVSDWRAICDEAGLIRLSNKTEAQYFFESRFDAYLASVALNPRGLFTGYYEPELQGSWKPNTRYRVPIYTRPKDLLSADLGRFDPKWSGQHIAGRLQGNALVPYATRDDIERGALKGRQLEVLWVDDQIEAFILHIQGSGRIRLPDGSSVRIGYAGRNGHRYTPIGRELVAAGVMKLEQITMPAIRAWLETNPIAGQALMRKNKSFIFFRIVEGEGPIGSQGVPLTAGRSLAVDTNHIPLGLPLWLVTTEAGEKQKRPLRRLVIAQDTGSAIKGAIRGDLFWGFGRDAGIKAGMMKEQGRYFLLLPKSAAAS